MLTSLRDEEDGKAGHGHEPSEEEKDDVDEDGEEECKGRWKFGKPVPSGGQDANHAAYECVSYGIHAERV